MSITYNSSYSTPGVGVSLIVDITLRSENSTKSYSTLLNYHPGVGVSRLIVDITLRVEASVSSCSMFLLKLSSRNSCANTYNLLNLFETNFKTEKSVPSGVEAYLSARILSFKC